MSALRLPGFWHGLTGYAKARYLCDSHQAPDFKAAYAILRNMRPKKPAPVPVQQVVARMEQQKLW